MSIKTYFLTRSQLDQEINNLKNHLKQANNLLNEKIESCVARIKEMDPHKFYFVVLPGSTQEELQRVQDFLNIAAKRVEWTVPKIFALSQKLEEYSAGEIKDILKGKRGG